MTTSKQVFAPYAGTAAAFQAFVTGVSNGLHAVATVTTDTGQIAPASVALPTAGSSAGYEIYKFNDALQASQPVLVKVEYGYGNASYYDPQLWITVGTATDGAGNITQNASARIAVGNSNISTGNKFTSFFSGDGSHITFGLYPGSFNSGGSYKGSVVAIERTRDTTGAGTGAGILLLTGNAYYNTGGGTYSQQWNEQAFSFGMNVWSQNPGIVLVPWPPKMNTTYPSLSDGTTVTVLPVLIATPLVNPPQLSVVAASNADIAPFETVSLTVSGAAHSYLMLAYTDFGYSNGTETSHSIAMRFE